MRHFVAHKPHERPADRSDRLDQVERNIALEIGDHVGAAGTATEDLDAGLSADAGQRKVGQGDVVLRPVDVRRLGLGATGADAEPSPVPPVAGLDKPAAFDTVSSGPVEVPTGRSVSPPPSGLEAESTDPTGSDSEAGSGIAPWGETGPGVS